MKPYAQLSVPGQHCQFETSRGKRETVFLASPLSTILMADEEGKPGNALADPEELVPEGEAVVYEEELLQNPYSLKLWLRYLQARIPHRLVGCY
jgi:hypothetical protein